MNGSDLKRDRERLGVSIEDLASDLDIAPAVVRAWERDRRRVPRRFIKLVEWHLSSAERERVLARSGLPECSWVQDWEAAFESRELEAGIQDLESHVSACELCRRRERFVDDRLGPPGDYPLGFGVRLIGFVGDLFVAPTRRQRAMRIVAIVVTLLFVANLFRFLPHHEALALLVYPLAIAVMAVLGYCIYEGLATLRAQGSVERWLARSAAGCVAMVGFMATFLVSGYGSLFARGEPFSWGEGILVGVGMGLTYATLWPLARNTRG